jgi:hypothetical protein
MAVAVYTRAEPNTGRLPACLRTPDRTRTEAPPSCGANGDHPAEGKHVELPSNCRSDLF